MFNVHLLYNSLIWVCRFISFTLGCSLFSHVSFILFTFPSICLCSSHSLQVFASASFSPTLGPLFMRVFMVRIILTCADAFHTQKKWQTILSRFEFVIVIMMAIITMCSRNIPFIFWQREEESKFAVWTQPLKLYTNNKLNVHTKFVHTSHNHEHDDCIRIPQRSWNFISLWIPPQSASTDCISVA